MIEYGKALEKLNGLIAAQGTGEKEFQKHLAEHPWMFGSEYSELLPRHNWTRDEKLDYMLRRTADIEMLRSTAEGTRAAMIRAGVVIAAAVPTIAS